MKPSSISAAVAVALFGLSGCSQTPAIPAPEFGDTVRSVMESQIHDHEAAIHPNPDAVEGSDPYRLDAALDVYRGATAAPEQVQRPITINTGIQ